MSFVNLGNDNFSRLSNTNLSASSILGALNPVDIANLVAVGMLPTSLELNLVSGETVELSNANLLQAANRGGLIVDGNSISSACNLDLGPDTQANARSLANLLGLREIGNSRILQFILNSPLGVGACNLQNSSDTSIYVQFFAPNQVPQQPSNNKPIFPASAQPGAVTGRVLVSLQANDTIVFNIM
jgi:hypothetical protein